MSAFHGFKGFVLIRVDSWFHGILDSGCPWPLFFSPGFPDWGGAVGKAVAEDLEEEVLIVL